jgi:hypothetical protein
MSIQAPEVQRAPTKPPPVEGPKPPTRGKGRSLWIVAVIVALLAGLIGGYFLRWGTEPTKTVIERVAAPAYAGDATTHSAVVRFTTARDPDEKQCTYSGPAEIQAGSSLQLTFFSDDERPASFYVARLASGATWEQMEVFPPPLASPDRILDRDLAGSERRPVELTEASEGLYGVFCSQPFLLQPATIIRVVPA